MRVIVSPAADRDISWLARGVAGRVILALRALRDHHPPTWRIRVGDWRVLYEIDDQAGVVTITGVRHRSKAY